VDNAPLATTADLQRLGYDVTDPMIARASARIRAFTRQSITLVEDDVSPPLEVSDPLYLPQRPVVSVAKVEHVMPDDTLIELPTLSWQLRNNAIYGVNHKQFWPFMELTRWVRVTYTHGFAIVPDEILDVVGSVATRLANQPVGMEAGIRQRTIDDYAETFATDALDVASDLLPGEKTALQRILGARRNGTVAM